MSEYTKTTWQNGDVITAEKLNNIQNGIANNSNGGVRVIDFQPNPSGEYQYESGLSAKDFMGAFVCIEEGQYNDYYLISSASYSQSSEDIVLNAVYDRESGAADSADIAVVGWQYYPETGIMKILSHN